MALDLGGTNFRVLVIDIDGDSFNMENEIFAIPQSIMVGTGEQVQVVTLFDDCTLQNRPFTDIFFFSSF